MFLPKHLLAVFMRIAIKNSSWHWDMFFLLLPNLLLNNNKSDVTVYHTILFTLFMLKSWILRLNNEANYSTYLETLSMFADKKHLITHVCIIMHIIGGFTGLSSASWQQGTFIRQLVALAPQQSGAHGLFWLLSEVLFICLSPCMLEIFLESH